MARRLSAAIIAAVILILTVAGIAPAQTTPPATLSGEDLFTPVGSTVITSEHCNPTGNSSFSYEVSGVAIGPYPGTFTEHGTVTFGPQTPLPGPGLIPGVIPTSVDVQFSIDSPAGQVTGTKELFFSSSPTNNAGACIDTPTGTLRYVREDFLHYTADIRPPTGGTYRDRGISFMHVEAATGTPFPGATSGDYFAELFSSDLLAPELILPATKEQCKNGGWQSFGVFANQGDCASFVASGGKNPPKR